MTHQYLEPIAPADAATTLALSLECPDCHTRRGFQIAQSLEQILKREMTSIAFADCAACGRRLCMTLGWTQRTPGWTTRPIGDRAHSAEVGDSMSLEMDHP